MSIFQMYSEGSDFLAQNNDTALQYFKKASDLVSVEKSKSFASSTLD